MTATTGTVLARDGSNRASAGKPLSTLRARVCAARRWSPEEFGRRLFWLCLHRRAVPWVPMLRLLDPEYFAPDFELVARAAGVRTWRELREEIRDFTTDSRNAKWLRRQGRVRISTRRLQRLARPYLG